MALFEVQSISHTKDVIRFTWGDAGGSYVVYRDHYLLYEGTNTSFQDEQFKRGQLHCYSIERIVNDVVVDVIRLQTSAYDEEKDTQNPLQFLVLTTIVSKSQTMLCWERIQGVDKYEIYKDDIFLKEIDTHFYIDKDIDLTEAATYRIQSKRPIAESRDRFNKLKAVVSKVLEWPNSVGRQPTMETFNIVKHVHPSEELLRPTAERSNVQVTKWKFRYTTFIKEKVVQNPNVFSRSRMFKGDGRDFHPTGKGYRTRVDIGLNYAEARFPMVCTKHIGHTVAYNHFGRVRKVSVADGKGIVMKRKDYEIGQSGFLLTHDVENPLLPSPHLNYEVWAVLQRNGLFDVTGFHNQAPHHEVYLSANEEGWQPIHLSESNGLIWLSDLTGWNYWRYSNFK